MNVELLNVVLFVLSHYKKVVLGKFELESFICFRFRGEKREIGICGESTLSESCKKMLSFFEQSEKATSTTAKDGANTIAILPAHASISNVSKKQRLATDIVKEFFATYDTAAQEAIFEALVKRKASETSQVPFNYSGNNAPGTWIKFPVLRKNAVQSRNNMIKRGIREPLISVL